MHCRRYHSNIGYSPRSSRIAQFRQNSVILKIIFPIRYLINKNHIKITKNQCVCNFRVVFCQDSRKTFVGTGWVYEACLKKSGCTKESVQKWPQTESSVDFLLYSSLVGQNCRTTVQKEHKKTHLVCSKLL